MVYINGVKATLKDLRLLSEMLKKDKNLKITLNATPKNNINITTLF